MSQKSTFQEPSEDNRKLVSPLAIVGGLIVTAGFFVYMYGVASNHTPDVPDMWKHIIAAYTSTCLTGVFWLALQGFYVTLVDQMRRKKSGVQS